VVITTLINPVSKKWKLQGFGITLADFVMGWESDTGNDEHGWL
jgi:hypothetical protein